MNFTILFHAIGSLNFHVQFSVLSYYTQDLFFFQGGNSSAHLYCNNSTVSLYIHDDKDFQLYQADILNKLKFSWRGFKVNGTDMKIIKSTGSLDLNNLNEFTFLSPVLDLNPDTLMESCSDGFNESVNNAEFIHSLNLKNVNYGYIAAIILIITLALELKMKIPLIIERLFGKQNEPELEESDYEEMENIETFV